MPDNIPKHDDLQKFLEQEYPKPESAETPMASVPDIVSLAKAAQSEDLTAMRNYADAMVLWRDESQLDRAIEVYETSLQKEPGHGPTHFHLGVAYRKRYESPNRRAGDFDKAVVHWRKALGIDPNQYIWRRRIQQYGPRLDKPYPFYDWVTQAREDIKRGGDVPFPLLVEPGGAEIAHPAKKIDEAQNVFKEPDPEGRILRDEDGFIRVETTVVPSTATAGSARRVHVVFRPEMSKKAHWNNEVSDLVFWINPPAGWQLNNRYHTVRSPREEVSQESREIEFELIYPSGFTGTIKIPAYALYYVCEDVNGTCLYRRQDVSVRIDVESGQ